MGCTESDLGPLAKKAFGYLKQGFLNPQFDGYNIYWKLGNSFDTIVDYFLLGPDYSADAQGFGPTALAAYNNPQVQKNACWYDDFGWWGIAAHKASQHPKLFGTNAAQSFQAISDSCWQTMTDHAPKVWENNGSNPEFKNLRPRFEGGVWNCDWSEADGCGRKGQYPPIPPTCICPSDDTAICDDQGSALQGIQNTVTNGLYLVLAARRSEWGVASREYSFLESWFNVADPTDALLDRFGGGALVRERVGTYGVQDERGQYYKVCGYEPTLAWAGDQGLILGGAVAMSAPNRAPYIQLAQDIAAGVKLQTEKYNHGILGAWITCQGGDPGDYDTGIGVYMRYLLSAYQDQAMTTYLRNSGYVDFVCKNAATITAEKLDADNSSNGPAQSPVVDLTNDLATLVTAIVMSRG